MRRILAGILAISSGVRLRGSGSSAGSPSGSVPSGSSRAARWPCMRWAFSSDVAACTAWSICSSTKPAGMGAGSRATAAAAAGVVGGERVRARLVDQLVEGGLELLERLAAGIADHRDHQRAAAVLLLDVDGDAEVHGLVVDADRLAPVLGVEVV